ncbi:hypothetical protein COCON_G00204700 [Conger conger]|uniref:Ig-like domain-containing protein n=1 Tax=Conger conger TaxID=82655 RepID=A0A9Q1CZK7_CONCO|nr:immunoglobulin superfamily member 6-like [Conger conger]KAJ8253858.1 hypothetical protein COCON_G00204700 [Conger conger]
MVTISLLFQLSFTLIYMKESLGEACKGLINQTEEVPAFTTVQAITLHCPIPDLCRNSAKSTTHWFVFRNASHQEISARGPKYSIDDKDLTIHSPQTNDSGVYYCGVVLSSKKASIGTGTRLVVREKRDTTTQTALLWTLFAVLALYSLLILVLLLSKKTRREIFRSERTSTTDKRGSARRLQFRAVVQELYKRRNLRGTGQNTTQTYSPHSNVERPHAYLPDEDVYQNM